MGIKRRMLLIPRSLTHHLVEAKYIEIECHISHGNCAAAAGWLDDVMMLMTNRKAKCGLCTPAKNIATADSNIIGVYTAPEIFSFGLK